MKTIAQFVQEGISTLADLQDALQTAMQLEFATIPVWGFTGSPIQMPTAYAFSQSTVSPDPSLPFNQALSALLIDLQTCWTSGSSPDIGAMFTLQDLGQGLIKQGIRPEFLWVAPSTV